MTVTATAAAVSMAATAARRSSPTAWGSEGVPWWALIALAAAVVVVLVLRRRVRTWLARTAIAVVTVAAVAAAGYGFGGDLGVWLQQQWTVSDQDPAGQRLALAEQRQAATEQDLARVMDELAQTRAEARQLAELADAYKAEADRRLNDYQAALDLVAEYEAALGEEALRGESAATSTTGSLSLPAEGRTHPEVQQQARSVIEEVVATHDLLWPWLRAAHGSADFVFYDSAADLPCDSGSAAACVITREGVRPVVVASLDAVRSSRFDELVVHELAHLWAGSSNAGLDMAAAFAVHYVGCRAHGLGSERLAGELLADAVVMLVLEVGYMADSGNLGHYGYYDTDFQGCLVDQPPSEELWELLLIHLADPAWISGG